MTLTWLTSTILPSLRCKGLIASHFFHCSRLEHVESDLIAYGHIKYQGASIFCAHQVEDPEDALRTCEWKPCEMGRDVCSWSSTPKERFTQCALLEFHTLVGLT